MADKYITKKLNHIQFVSAGLDIENSKEDTVTKSTFKSSNFGIHTFLCDHNVLYERHPWKRFQHLFVTLKQRVFVESNQLHLPPPLKTTIPLTPIPIERPKTPGFTEVLVLVAVIIAIFIRRAKTYKSSFLFLFNFGMPTFNIPGRLYYSINSPTSFEQNRGTIE